MGKRRKAQLQHEREARLAKTGAPATKTDAWDHPDDFHSIRPLYDGSELPWERDIAGFEVARDNGQADEFCIASSASQASEDDHAADTGPQDGGSKPSVTNEPYEQLQAHEIRVLELAAGTVADPLRGSLLTVDIRTDNELYAAAVEDAKSVRRSYGISVKHSKKISWTAISYCWSADGVKHMLCIDGHQILIPSTVASILKYIRSPDHTVRVWIDQICIDQDNIKDKESQISLMAAIYNKARNTLIWLGDGPEDGAFQLLQSIAYGLWGTSEDNTTWHEALDPMIIHRAASMRALMRLFQSAWFQRTWIVQELALSWEPYIKFGSLTMSWESFSAAAVYLADFDVFILPDTTVEERKLATLGVKSMKNLDAVRLAHLVKYDESRTGQPSLISVLEDTRHAAVTLPVDKIYGVLAMCDNLLPVDYGVLAHDVFKAVSRDILHTNALAVLLSNIDHDCETSSMPCWAVDWSRPRQTTPIMSGILRSHQMAGGFPKDQSLELAYDSLATKALLVDIIDTYSETMQAAQLSIVNPQEANTDLKSVIDLVEQYLSASERQIDFTTFCAVLVAGQNDTRKSAFPMEYIEVFSLLCDESTGRAPSIPGQTYSVRQQKGHLTLAHLERRMPMQTYRSLQTAFEQAVLNRRLAWSRSGELILVPNYARPGDIVGIIQGCPVPYVLRKRRDGQYAFLGECYLHAVMDGTYFGAHQNEVQAISIV